MFVKCETESGTGAIWVPERQIKKITEDADGNYAVHTLSNCVYVTNDKGRVREILDRR